MPNSIKSIPEELIRDQMNIHKTGNILQGKSIRVTSNMIPNGFYLSRIFRQQKTISLIIIILLILDSILQILYYQLKKIEHQFSLNFLNCSSLCHIFSCLFTEIMQRTIANLSIQRKYKNKILNIITLFVSICAHPYTFWQAYHIESIFKNPISESQQFFPLKINNLLILASILNNIWDITFKIAIFSSFSEPRSRRVYHFFGENTIFHLFKFKCIFRQQPILTVFIVWLLSTLYFSLALNILEYNMPIISNKFRHYQNCFWFTLVTIISVGFGDVTPHSHYGYILALICSVFGTFIMSLILIISILNVRLDQREAQTLKTLLIDKQRVVYQRLAKLYIRKKLWRLWINYKHKKSEIQSNQQKKLKRKLKIITDLIHKQQKKLEQDVSIIHQLQNITFNIHFLKKNNLKILGLISGSMFFKTDPIIKDVESSKSELSQKNSLISISEQVQHHIILEKQPYTKNSQTDRLLQLQNKLL